MKYNIKKIIIKEVFNTITEARSTKENPNIFWLVTSISDRAPERTKELATRNLSGLKGISGSNRIVMHWLGTGRNAVIVMNAQSVINNNKNIERIEYNNPEQLTKNNLAILRRLYQAGNVVNSSGNWKILNNIFRGIENVLIKSGNPEAVILGKNLQGGYIRKYEIADKYENNIELQLNSPKELADYIWDAIVSIKTDGELGISNEEWESVVRKAIVLGVRTYRSEGEWIVSGESFRIPKQSKLIVSVPTPLEDFPEGAQKSLQKGMTPKLGVDIDLKKSTPDMARSIPIIKTVFEFNLDKQFDIKFINSEKFNEIKIKMLSKHKYG